VPPALRLAGTWVEVHAPAGADFLVAEVGGSEGAPGRVLRCWRGRADGRGVARFDAATFAGEGATPVRVLLLVPSAGASVASAVVEIGPSARASRSDR
jgi:hypothetical protein